MSLSHISFLKSVQYAVLQFLLIFPMRKRQKKKKKEWKIEGPKSLVAPFPTPIRKYLNYNESLHLLRLHPLLLSSWKSYIRLVRVMKNAAWIMKVEQCPILPYIHKVNRGIIFSLLIFKWRNWFVLDTAWLSTDWQKCFIYQIFV